MIRGAIFDMDGTLLDSMSIWNTVGEDYLKSLGYQPQAGLNEAFQNMSLSQAANHYRSAYGVSLSAEQIMDGINSQISGFYRDQVALKPGILPFLQALEKQGVRMCVATATDRPMVLSALERCGIARYFSEIFTCTEVGHGKDEPVIYQLALNKLGVPQSQTVVFEDALYALKTAKANGFFTAGIYDPYEPNQQELRTLADVFLPDYFHLSPFWEFASAL